MAEVIAELVKILPENDWMKFALLVFFLLLVVLREKLFIGIRDICRYLYRWVRCRFGKHTWLRGAGRLDQNMVTGTFIYQCVICGKTDVFPGTL